MKNKILHLVYLIFSKIPDIYFFDKYLKTMRAQILSLQSNKNIAKNCQISSHVKIWLSTQLDIGNNVTIKEKVIISGKCKIGNNSQILSFTFIDGSGGIEIGDFTQIGRENHIYSHTHDIYPKDVKVIYSKEIYKPVSIGSDVMLFSKVSIMAGVCIADGCVIAHGSVVSKNTQEFEIYGGVPAKKIGIRT